MVRGIRRQGRRCGVRQARGSRSDLVDTVPPSRVPRHFVDGGTTGRLDGCICYARDRENLEALAAALRELKAKVRGVDRDVPFVLDARSLKMGDSFTSTTIAGNLDCLGTPAGSKGYDPLARTATKMDVGGIEVAVASLDDLIQMKRVAGRPKDLIEVEVLAAVRDELERH